MDDEQIGLGARFRLREVAPDHPGMQVAMPLVSLHDDELRCIGTAFAVAPRLAITAAHVVQDWQVHQERRDGYRRRGATFAVAAFQWFEGSICEWHVDAAYALGVADLAFLRLQRPAWYGDGADQVKPRCARISLNPPGPGETVRVFGFPGSYVEENVVHVSPSECVAKVREVTIKSRLAFRPASYVELAGEIQGGMSGGPCFDSNWNVVGMAWKGWDLLEDNPSQPPLAFMALLWPAMSIPIDSFGTGKSRAWDLFKSGPAQAVGHRRIHFTAGGQMQFGAVDPESLIPLSFPIPEEHLAGALNFARENSRQALLELRTWSEEASKDSAAGDPNRLHRILRHLFWEFDATLRISMRVVAARVGFAFSAPVEWDRFIAAWRDHGASSDILDRLRTLSFSWDGGDLFEIRTYAEWARSSMLNVLCGKAGGGAITVCMLDPCRKGGQQVGLPDGLERYFAATRRFTEGLLQIERAARAKTTQPAEPDNAASADGES